MPFVLSYISKNCAAIFVIFGTCHPNGSRKWIIKHFSHILTTGLHNDDAIVTSVKMQFTEQVIKVLGNEKQYSFPIKSALRWYRSLVAKK